MQPPARIHTMMMRAFVGPRPEGLLTRHLDDNKDNNTLANLAYGTQSENQLDAVRNGRNKNSQLTACHRGHDFTDENTRINTKGSRECRTCRRASDHASYLRRRQAAS